VPMKSHEQDGGECFRKWHRTRKANLLRLSGEPPKTLCVDQLNLTVCCRYAESLLMNDRIRRYLLKHHAEELAQMEDLVAEISLTGAGSGLGAKGDTKNVNNV